MFFYIATIFVANRIVLKGLTKELMSDMISTELLMTNLLATILMED